MSFSIDTSIPHGNACACSIAGGETPEIHFSSDPHGGPEAMWFCFRLHGENEKEREVKLVLDNYRNLLGAGNAPQNVAIVSRFHDGQWRRSGPGTPIAFPDGRLSAFWKLPFKPPHTDFALCFPYGQAELESFLQNSGGYWKADAVGISQKGREILRLSNSYGGEGGKMPGIFAVSRQHSGETPGSWVLQGFLEYFAEKKIDSVLVWAAPFANIDGVVDGDYGKDNFPYDINRAWSNPPMRHETHVLRQDMHAWRKRCSPLLCLDFHAPGLSETEGIYSFIPHTDNEKPHPASLELAAALKDGLAKRGLAAENFTRSANYASRWNTFSFPKHCVTDLKIPALTFETPYSLAENGKKILLPEDYRIAGAAIAKDILFFRS